MRLATEDPDTDRQWLHEAETLSLDAHYTLLLDSGEHIEVESTHLKLESTRRESGVYFCR
jgi:hypothetical protein